MSADNIQSYAREELALQKDPKYRAYADEVSFALSNFDKAKEWQDLNKYLQKLHKVLGKYSFPSVPFKLLVSKRLAQCLNPALPAGVHQTTLETYDVIFSKLPPASLAADLSLYSIGLFPIFKYASTQVKPIILSLFEKYFLPLKQNLYPCLPGLICSILPGLEDEESSESYKRVFALLGALCDQTDPAYFHRSIWKLLITSPSIRGPATTYLLAKLPKKFPNQQAWENVVPDRSLVFRSLKNSVEDNQALVQRSLLDLLILHFPLDSGLFQQILKRSREDDEERNLANSLLQSMLMVLVRRDMSLTRRFFTFLLGSSESSDTKYFSKYGKDLLVDSVKEIFASPPKNNELATLPFKIMMCLLDKQEIGSVIIDDVLIDVLKSLHRHRDAPFSQEIIKAANLLLDQLEPQMLWNFLEGLINKEFLEETTSKTAQIELVNLLDTWIDVSPCKEEQVKTVFLPSLLRAIMFSLRRIVNDGQYDQLHSLLQISLKLIGKVQSFVEEDSQSPTTSELITRATESYQIFFQQAVNNYILPLAPQRKGPNDAHNFFDLTGKLLTTLHTHFAVWEREEDLAKMDSLPDWFESVFKCCQSQDPFISCIAIRTFVGLVSKGERESAPKLNQRLCLLTRKTQYFQIIAAKIWKLLDPEMAAVHYQVAHLFLDIHKVAPDITNEVVSDAIVHTQTAIRVHSYQKYALLWRLTGELGEGHDPFSQTLFNMLDSLNDTDPVVKLVGRTWLADSISKIERILDPLLRVLLDDSAARINSMYQKQYDTRRVLQVWRILKMIIECDFKLFMSHVAEKPVSKDILALNSNQVRFHQSQFDQSVVSVGSDFLFYHIDNYLDLLVVTALRFIQGKVPESFSADFVTQNGMVCSSSVDFLQFLLPKITPSKKAFDVSRMIQEPVLSNLAEAVSSSNLVLQVQLLGLLRIIVLLLARGPDSGSPLTDPADSPGIQPSEYSPLFLQTLLVGLLQSSSKNLRFYWLEFVTSCLSQLRNLIPVIIPPIVRCVCTILQTDLSGNIYDSVSAKDILIQLKSLKHLFNFCLQPTNAPVKPKEPAVPARFLSDWVSVFVPEIDVVPPKPLNTEAKRAILKELPGLVPALIQVWQSPNPEVPSPKTQDINSDYFSHEGEFHNKYSIQDQITQILDLFMEHYPVELMNAIIAAMISQNSDNPTSPISGDELKELLVEVLLHLERANVDSVVTALTSLLQHVRNSNKAVARRRASRRMGDILARTEDSILEFTLLYTQKANLSAQIWPTLAEFIKEGLSCLHPSTPLSLLRTMQNFVKKCFPDDRRQRREIQDLTQKLIENCIHVAGKDFLGPSPSAFPDNRTSVVISGAWATVVNVTENTKPAESQEIPATEQFVAANSSKVDSPLTSKDEANNLRVQMSLMTLSALPGILMPLIDLVFEDKADSRVQNTLIAILHHIVPHIKDRSQSNMGSILAAVSVIGSLTDYQYTLRAWRKDVMDLFFDQDFFQVDLPVLNKWKTVINALMNRDKTAFNEILRSLSKGIATAVQPAMIFTNRDHEILMKSKFLKRLSFAIFGGEMDQYLPSLAAIQEKVVEAFKMSQAIPVYVQAFLCLRVLLVRLSPSHLRSFWPVMLIEMIRIFSDTNDPMLVEAACKFLDSIIFLPLDEFNLYEWIFITDKLEILSENNAAFLPYIERFKLLNKKEEFTIVDNFLEKWHEKHPSCVSRPMGPKDIEELIDNDFLEPIRTL